MPFKGVKQMMKDRAIIEIRKKNIRQLIQENESLKKELSEMIRENRHHITDGICR